MSVAIEKSLVVRSEPIPFAVGDVVRLKKAHPCGSHDWSVVRLGADIGLKCHGCGRRILLPRREVERRLRQFVSHAGDGQVPAIEPESATTPEKRAVEPGS